MKKMNLKLSVALLVMALVTICVISCKKEENVSLPINKTSVIINEKDYATKIQNLSKETGIDIYALSKLEGFKKLMKQPQQTMDLVLEVDISDDILNELELLAHEIEVAYTAGDEEQVFVLYTKFCEICAKIPGFIFDVDEYGLQSFKFNPDLIPLTFPFEQMQAEAKNFGGLEVEIGNNYPEYCRLEAETKKEVLAAAFYLNFSTPKDFPNAETCRRAAKQMYAENLAFATASLEVALIGCAFSGPFAWACCASAGAVYGAAVVLATSQYKRSLKAC